MSIWMNATWASAQETPSNVQSTSSSPLEDPQAAAAINESNRMRRMQASLPMRRLPCPGIQTSRGAPRSHPNKGSVRLLPALTVPTVRGRNAPAMNGSLNYVEMVTHGGPIVSGVLIILVISSLVSWTIIFRKLLHLRRGQRQPRHGGAAHQRGPDRHRRGPLRRDPRAGRVQLVQLAHPRAGQRDAQLQRRFPQHHQAPHLQEGGLMAFGSTEGGPRRAMTDINVTPLVDVMLVLLIIFMVTAPLIQSGVKVDLPRASAQQMEHQEEKLVLTITHDRRVFLGNSEIPPADLEKKLSSNARIQKEKELYLHADRSLPYGQVVEIMAVARRAGVESLGMITEPDRELRRP